MEGEELVSKVVQEADRDPERKKFEEDSTDEFCFCPEEVCSFSGSIEALMEHLTKDHQITLREFRYGETLCVPLYSVLPYDVLKGEDGNIFVLCYTVKKGLSFLPSPSYKNWRSNAVFVVNVQPPNLDLTPQFMFTLRVMEGPIRSNDCTAGFRVRFRNRTTGEFSYTRLRWWIQLGESRPVPRSTLKDLYEHVSQGLIFKHINIHKRPTDAYLCIQTCPVSENKS